MKTNGINDVIGVNSAIENIADPLVQMMIHWCNWRRVIDANGVNDANGTNDSNGVIDLNVQWHQWQWGAPLAPY